MSLQAASVADNLFASLPRLNRLKLTDLSSDYQKTTALQRVIKNEMIKESDGNALQFNILKDTNGSFRTVPLGYQTNIDQTNVLGQGTMPWRYVNWYWSMESRLVDMYRGKSRIVDIADAQRRAGLGSAILGFERLLWRVPTATGDSAGSFAQDPVGIPYYVVKSSTDALTDTTAHGFNGNVPSGYTFVAGVTPSTDFNGRYQNFADVYVDVSDADLVTRMCNAQFYTDWTPLTPNFPDKSKSDDCTITTNYAAASRLRQILRGQNNDLGTELAWGENKAVFMRTDIEPIKALESDTTNPFYMLNWRYMSATALEGNWMKETMYPGEKNPQHPTIDFVNVDCAFNLECWHRRAQAVLSTATTMFAPP